MTSADLRQNEVMTSAGVVRYYDVGEGPVIVFVHGFMTNSHLWLPVVERVRKQFRCIVPDWPLGSHANPMLPGADLSQPGLVAIMASFFDALHLGDVTLVGNDMGGALSQQFVAAHPAKVARLVLTPCDVFDNFPPGIFKFLIWLPQIPAVPFALSMIMRWKAVRRTPISYGWLAKHGLTDAVAEHFVRPMIGQSSIRRDAVKVISQATPAVLHAIRDKLAAFTRPVEIVWPPEEKVFPFSDAEILRDLFPNARLTPVKDSYTFVALDQPDVLADVLLQIPR